MVNLNLNFYYNMSYKVTVFDNKIKLTERARYLGLVVDRKLLWIENIEERVKR